MEIEVRNLVKTYKTVRAVDGVSFSVESGSVFAFLGTNGAGKTTTISCITTVLPFDSGQILVGGHDVRHAGAGVRERIGVVFQESVLDNALTVRENLQLRGRLYSLDRTQVDARIDELAALMTLTEVLGRRYGKLSGGQRRRVDIARALLHGPSILFLDEPTAGLDPAGRATVWSTIHELRDRHGLTVFLTTHYMEETEEADEVCIIDAGTVIATGTPARLRAAHSRSVLTLSLRDGERLGRVADAAGLRPANAGDVVEVPVPDAATARSLLAELGDDVVDFEFRHGRMDDVFLALTGRERIEEVEA